VKILVDTNVILDVLADRAPFAGESARVLERIERSDDQGFVAGHTITTLFSLIDKRAGREEARDIVRQLLGLFTVVAVDRNRLLQALDLGLDDFEDGVQAACAEHASVDCLITRNKRDFEGAPCPVSSPAEFLAARGS
jgi:predicted nucleic acid-binding protein